LISPAGEIVLFDDGVRDNCDLPVSYLQQLGITRVDYHVGSHYHDDHIGCAAEVLGEFPLQKAALDRGDTYDSATFKKYVGAFGQHRKTATAGMTLTLDQSSAHPVTIDVRVVNGHGSPV